MHGFYRAIERQVCLVLYLKMLVGPSQGPRSNFEIGGDMTEYWGGTIHFFLLTLYNFKNIGGGARAPPPLPPYSAVPASVNTNRARAVKNLRVYFPFPSLGQFAILLLLCT